MASRSPLLGPHARPNVLSAHSRGTVLEDVWPPLFWGPERLEEIKRKTVEVGWARECYETLLDEAGPILGDEPQLPIEPIGWRHSFYSPLSGEHLVFDPGESRRFVDPSNQQVWEGVEYRRAWALFVHERTYRLMRSMALLYRLNGDERYAKWAVAGLEKAITMFSHSELREGNSSEALYYQPLYDAQVLALIANTCALLKGTRPYSPALHQRVVRGIFEDAMPYQMRFMESRGAHNMTCYVDAALMFAGLFAERHDWVDLALHHPTGGFMAMIQNGLAQDEDGDIDGFWREGTQFYHFYSLCPLLSVYALWKASGLPLPAERAQLEHRLLRMLLAPVEMCDEHLRLPVFGDLGAPRRTKLMLYRHVYEMGTGVLDETRLKPVLAAIYSTGLSRGNLTALACGPDVLDVEPYRPKSVLLSATGVAFIREKSFHAYLKAGPSLGGHDHCDKLSFGLSAHGQLMLADLGTAGYAVRDYRAYCRSSLAHSTVLVDDQETQKVAQAHLEMSAAGCWAQATITGPDSISLTRRVALRTPLLQVDDEYTASAPHLFTCVVHPYGPAAVLCGGEPADVVLPALPRTRAFGFLMYPQRRTSSKPICLEWQAGEELWLRGWIWADVPFEYVLGQTPGHPRYDFRNTLLIRLQGAQVKVHMVLEIHTGQATVLSCPKNASPSAQAKQGAHLVDANG